MQKLFRGRTPLGPTGGAHSALPDTIARFGEGTVPPERGEGTEGERSQGGKRKGKREKGWRRVLSVFGDWFSVPFVKNSQKTVKIATTRR